MTNLIFLSKAALGRKTLDHSMLSTSLRVEQSYKRSSISAAS
jgi:hypothetical protein